MDDYLGALEWRPCVISPLNGPANTRDLAWPYKISDFKSRRAGPEFSRPETKPKFSPGLAGQRDQTSKIVRRTGRANAACSRKVSVIREGYGNCVVGPRGLELRARHAVLSNRSLRGRTAGSPPKADIRQMVWAST